MADIGKVYKKEKKKKMQIFHDTLPKIILSEIEEIVSWDYHFVLLSTFISV